LVNTEIAGKIKACQSGTPRGNAFTAAPANSGWTISVQLTGHLSGVSVWSVTGTTVTPANQLAQTLAGGCPGGGATPPDLTGYWRNKADTNTSDPAWHLIASNQLQNLDATWQGGAGHSNLRGTFHGSLTTVSGSYTYFGNYTITESGNTGNGSMAVKIDNVNQIEIALKPNNGGKASSYTFVRS
jgi:hypothetical protein